jgi:hypothetical protein
MRSAIAKIGTSLAALNENEPTAPPSHATVLLNAQAEAIQGLTRLVLKGQQVQAELINASASQTAQTGTSGMPKWIYYIMGVMMIWNLLGMIF